jgi:hypothetical protein
MPTITSLSQYVFHNLGPLTTTFNVPLSCATKSNNVVIAFKSDLTQIYGQPDCEHVTQGDCFPSGSAIDSLSSALSDSPLRGYAVDYFSPGLHCPTNWVTVGMAARSADGAMSSNGIFTPKTITETDFVAFPAYVNVLTAGLEPGETAALCCPR